MRSLRRFGVIPVALAAGAAVLPIHAAVAQAYPARMIRLLTSEAGGGSDLAGRVIAPALAAALGQQVIIENRGGGVIAGEVVAKSPPDGHTLLIYGNTLWLLPLMRAKVAYDTLKDFQPVSLAAASPTVLLVHPSVPVRSVKELVALAKARPGVLNYASAALGTSNHLSAELFRQLAGVEITRVGYKGGPSALNSVLAGETHMIFSFAGNAVPQVRLGRVRGLAVTSAQPTPLAPDLPTMAAAGLPGCEVAFTPGVFVCARRCSRSASSRHPARPTNSPRRSATNSRCSARSSATRGFAKSRSTRRGAARR
jgi:tripartite-type tricarboxylate transporter receptor subunit TctC